MTTRLYPLYEVEPWTVNGEPESGTLEMARERLLSGAVVELDGWTLALTVTDEVVLQPRDGMSAIPAVGAVEPDPVAVQCGTCGLYRSGRCEPFDERRPTTSEPCEAYGRTR